MQPINYHNHTYSQLHFSYNKTPKAIMNGNKGLEGLECVMFVQQLNF